MTEQQATVINNDPEFQRLAQAYQRALTQAGPNAFQVANAGPEARALQAYYQTHGIDPHNTAIQNGRLIVEHPGRDFARIAAESAGLALGGSAALGGFPAAGATTPAAGAGGAGAAGTLPSTAIGSSTPFTAPAVTSSLAGGGAGAGILGALSRYAGPIGDIGNVLTNAAQANAVGRRADAGANARAIAENNAAKVAAAQYNLNLPSVRTNQVARGEVLNTMQDAPLTGDPRIDKFAGGGLIPSAFGPNSRAAGAELSRTAMQNLMNPSQDRLTPQEIPPISGSTPENIAAGLGIGADIFSLLAKYGRNPNVAG